MLTASVHGHIHVVKCLAELGADLNIESIVSVVIVNEEVFLFAHNHHEYNLIQNRENALILASINDHVEVVKYLVDNGADFNMKNNVSL